MKRSHALALSGVALFLGSTTLSFAKPGSSVQQCVPAVANASMYGNCRLHIVKGDEVCRCAILPLALRRVSPPLDQAVSATGAIERPAQTLSSNSYVYNDGWVNPATG